MTEAHPTEDLVTDLRWMMDHPDPPGKRKILAAAIAQIERLRRELVEEKHRSFQDGRITYKGFNYGVGSQHGIDSLRRAIEGNGHG